MNKHAHFFKFVPHFALHMKYASSDLDMAYSSLLEAEAPGEETKEIEEILREIWELKLRLDRVRKERGYMKDIVDGDHEEYLSKFPENGKSLMK